MMAMDKYFLFPSLDWDPQSALGAGDLHERSLSLCKATGSPDSSQASTGYLQDAVAGWNGRGKRRRMSSSSSSPLHDSAPPPPPPPLPLPMTSEELQDLLRGFWDSSCCGDPTTLQADGSNVIFQDVDIDEEALKSPVIFSSGEKDDLHRSKPWTSSSKANECYCESTGYSNKATMKKKKKTASVAYPFAVVKPGGDEGDVTLDDINARILMRPRRPVRHPVGEYASGPRRVSPAGLGLSGKAVVSLTRIQTQGRGTITIIRTK